ncbi:MAG: tRNA (adenosine(37)-N6)-threonylcarbamoyltransferase complex dimerization subunit type 1 TsaB [Fimbriimonas sp.]
MILAISTSSPLASVAWIDADGKVVWSGEQVAPQRASEAILKLLSELRETVDLKEATCVAVDLGPGSFTGVRVGVAIAKTMAWAHGLPTWGRTAFDLISATQTVVVPSKRGEVFIRRPGEEPTRQAGLPTQEAIGYGPLFEKPTFPKAERFAALVAEIEHQSAANLLPAYFAEPSISTPKKPYRGEQ